MPGIYIYMMLLEEQDSTICAIGYLFSNHIFMLSLIMVCFCIESFLPSRLCWDGLKMGLWNLRHWILIFEEYFYVVSALGFCVKAYLQSRLEYLPGLLHLDTFPKCFCILVPQERRLDAAIEELLKLENQMRCAADVSRTRRVVVAIVQLCYEARAWKTLNDQIRLLSRRQPQLQQVL